MNILLLKNKFMINGCTSNCHNHINSGVCVLYWSHGTWTLVIKDGLCLQVTNGISKNNLSQVMLHDNTYMVQQF